MKGHRQPGERIPTGGRTGLYLMSSAYVSFSFSCAAAMMTVSRRRFRRFLQKKKKKKNDREEGAQV